MCSPLLFSPHPQTLVKVAQKIDEDNEGALGILSKVLGIRSPQSVVPMKDGAWRLATIMRYFDVSIKYEYISLYNKALSLDNIVIRCYMCDLIS
jgi:hypothetical protein